MYELSNKGKMTYSDYAAINDGNRYELIEGELIMAPAPSFRHQKFSARLSFLLLSHIDTVGAGELVTAPIDVILNDTSIVQPDIIFISKENYSRINEKGINGAPDLVIEIISPSSITYDRYTKKDLYEKNGIKELWLADINNRTIEIFELKDSVYVLASFAAGEGIVKSKVLTEFEMEIRDIFEKLDFNS